MPTAPQLEQIKTHFLNLVSEQCSGMDLIVLKDGGKMLVMGYFTKWMLDNRPIGENWYYPAVTVGVTGEVVFGYAEAIDSVWQDEIISVELNEEQWGELIALLDRKIIPQ